MQVGNTMEIKFGENGKATSMFFLYFIGELLPLALIFTFHYQNNKTFEQKIYEYTKIQNLRATTSREKQSMMHPSEEFLND